LEGVKDVDNASEANGVDGAVGIAVLVIDHLEHAPPAKSLQGFSTRVLFAILRIVDRQPHDAAYLVRERPQVVS
jgi:hypothetical protein